MRRFEAVEVTAPALDLRSHGAAHPLPDWTLQSPLVSGLREAFAAQPGVVIQAGDLHVRGGRTGETLVTLDDLPLNEPVFGRAIEVPVMAIANAELVSGTAGARYAGALAGQLDVRTVNPTATPEFAWRWKTDRGLDTRFDQYQARVTAPLPFAGLGVVAVGDARLDDTTFPALRTMGRHRFAGLSYGWRAENRVLGFVKIAPVKAPGRASLEVFADRGVHAPYDPAWVLDGWVYLPPNPKDAPRFFEYPDTNTTRYRAADHNAMTDERRIGALLSVASAPGRLRGRARLGWTRDRTVTSISGLRERDGQQHRAYYRWVALPDKFHVVWGDYPTYRETGSDVLSLSGDGEFASGSAVFSSGAGVRYEDVSLDETDWLPLGRQISGDAFGAPLDSVRGFHAWAPGAHAYGQVRWDREGMILTAGLRAEYWTAGPRANGHTLPWDGGGFLTISPRMGVVFPVSVREALSFSYTRIQQPPDRDLLYDDRVYVADRKPLGNPNLEPATMISYEAALKHLFDSRWWTQVAVFYRDLYDQPGAREITLPQGPTALSYQNADEGHAQGVEITLAHGGSRARFSASYTWMHAYGNESLAKGEPYGSVRDVNIAPIADRPLHWDREHSFVFSGGWGRERGWRLDWLSSLGSPLPWTPKERRTDFTDYSLVNSRRMAWVENTNLGLSWAGVPTRGLRIGLEVENLFNGRSEIAVTTDGYPNPVTNTAYDDYGAYRTETGQPGGAYWATGALAGTPHWVPLNDPRLFQTPRTIRMVVGTKW